jgi:hypothetical protein
VRAARSDQQLVAGGGSLRAKTGFWEITDSGVSSGVSSNDHSRHGLARAGISQIQDVIEMARVDAMRHDVARVTISETGLKRPLLYH